MVMIATWVGITGGDCGEDRVNRVLLVEETLVVMVMMVIMT